ncbi:MAG: acetyl-CoA carboxylase biotin carboxyl carrier protein [Clostridia bacterium]|nr:acetyl-CoA carboxylase biotin carboxyl carrier protein [Clostridia bacterium]
MQPLKITDTTLRDGHQSLWATRMRTKDMLPILEKIDAIGYHSLEVWGGATFDVCLRYLNEDPWERLRIIRHRVKKTKLQMLLRGQSLVGYQHYPDDVVKSFIEKSVENGIDIIRIFDALNDLRNMEVPIEATKKAGAHAQGTVVYTISPVHTLEHYLDTALQLQELGVDSVCIKDMAGLLSPFRAYELVKLLKERLDVPVQLHSHYVGGLAVGAYLEAARAGVDVVDTASVPLAFGASQPPVETVVRALQGTPHDTGLDVKALFEVADYFEELRKEMGFERGVTRISDMQVFEHQVPGGMISNLISQLKEQKAVHRLPEVLREIPRVRAELGYPPLVTPTSQIVGTQAVLNVLTGKRYKLVPGEVKAYVKGAYGRSPAPVDEEVRRLIIGDEPVFQGRPADALEPMLETARREIGEYSRKEEDVLSYCLFPQVARKFLTSGGQSTATEQNVSEKEQEVDKQMDLNDIQELIKVLDNSGIAELNFEGDGVKLVIKRNSGDPVPAQVQQEEPREVPGDKTGQGESTAEEDGKRHVIKAPMVGTFYRAPAPEAEPFVEVGSRVTPGQTVCIVEAMKLMNEIEAEVRGRVVEILVENGEPVEYGQELFVIAEE